MPTMIYSIVLGLILLSCAYAVEWTCEYRNGDYYGMYGSGARKIHLGRMRGPKCAVACWDLKTRFPGINAVSRDRWHGNCFCKSGAQYFRVKSGFETCKFTQVDKKKDSKYRMIKMGSCEDEGMSPIHTQQICNAAARALGLSDTRSGRASQEDRPEGCYFKRTSRIHQRLWLSGEQNHGNEADEFRWPVCKEKSETDGEGGHTVCDFKRGPAVSRGRSIKLWTIREETACVDRCIAERTIHPHINGVTWNDVTRMCWCEQDMLRTRWATPRARRTWKTCLMRRVAKPKTTMQPKTSQTPQSPSPSTANPPPPKPNTTTPPKPKSPPSPQASRTPPSRQCEDTVQFCARWGRSGHCIEQLYRSYMRTVCCKTCAKEKPKPTTVQPEPSKTKASFTVAPTPASTTPTTTASATETITTTSTTTTTETITTAETTTPETKTIKVTSKASTEKPTETPKTVPLPPDTETPTDPETKTTEQLSPTPPPLPVDPLDP